MPPLFGTPAELHDLITYVRLCDPDRSRSDDHLTIPDAFSELHKGAEHLRQTGYDPNAIQALCGLLQEAEAAFAKGDRKLGIQKLYEAQDQVDAFDEAAD